MCPLLQVVYNYLGSVLSEIKNVTNLNGGLRPTEIRLPGKSTCMCSGSWWLMVMFVPCLLGCCAGMRAGVHVIESVCSARPALELPAAIICDCSCVGSACVVLSCRAARPCPHMG